MIRVSVAVDAPQHAGLGSLLDYESEHALAAGALVRVPLGRREVTGLVWSSRSEPVAALIALIERPCRLSS